MPQRRDVSSVDAEDIPSERVAAVVEPSADLLDRALVGWERFLDTLQGASDE
ncbi:hypothetical protein ACFYZ4_16355 [Streptomyces sp. NPDC001513]|uniref:hypothetical protein n=1 Tax=Streptomyces sp. NPDC001513 TaxID=3364580 RepID=UPI00367A0434